MRKPALVAGGITLVLALSSCGGDGGGDVANLGSGGGGNGAFSNIDQLVESAKGQAEKSKSSKISMEMNAAGQQLTAEGAARYSKDSVAMRLNMKVGPQSMEMRMVDGSLFMKMPPQQAAALGGGPDKPWLKMPMDSKAMGMSSMAETSDPTKMLEQLKKFGGKVTGSEQTTLDGQQVTTYTVKLDVAKAAKIAGNGQPAAPGQKAPSGMATMKVSLNSDDLPVQLKVDVAGSPMTIKYTDWGTPVNVQAPPAGKVAQYDASAMPSVPGGN